MHPSLCSRLDLRGGELSRLSRIIVKSGSCRSLYRPSCLHLLLPIPGCIPFVCIVTRDEWRIRLWWDVRNRQRGGLWTLLLRIYPGSGSEPGEPFVIGLAIMGIGFWVWWARTRASARTDRTASAGPADPTLGPLEVCRFGSADGGFGCAIRSSSVWRCCLKSSA